MLGRKTDEVLGSQATRCPYGDCDHRFVVEAGAIGRAARCPRCLRPMTARPDAVWAELERRERAFVEGDGHRLERLERRPARVGSPRWRSRCYQQPGGDDPHWPAMRFDPQYEAGRDGRAPAHPIAGLVALLDDLRSQWNVGAIFRTADGAGWGALQLCGITPMPPAPGVLRVSLGAEQHLPWRYDARVVDALQRLTAEGFVPVALEQTADAEDLFRFEPQPRTVLIVGSEVAGVSREALHLCQQRVRIPMAGHKASLNAAVAFGIAAFALRQRYLADDLTSGVARQHHGGG